MKTRMLVGMGLALVAVAAVMAAEGTKVKIEGVKCIMAPSKDAKEANFVEYKGGKVFFCCQNCPKAFSANVEKNAAKANCQLVATGQAKQGACPISGMATDDTKSITVNGAKVLFCCENCQGKAEKADDKVELLFNDKAFEKGKFTVAK
jgi:YHS domain-containing protein